MKKVIKITGLVLALALCLFFYVCGGNGGGDGGTGCNYSDFSNYSGIWTIEITDENGTRNVTAYLQVDKNGNVVWETQNYCNTVYNGTIDNSHLNLSSNNEHWSITEGGVTTHCCTGTGQFKGDVITCTHIDTACNAVKCTNGGLYSATAKWTKQ